MAPGATKGSKRRFDAVFARNTRICTHPLENTTTRQHISSRGHFVQEVPQTKPLYAVPLKPYQPILDPPDETPLEDDVDDDTIDPNQKVHDPSELLAEQTEVSNV